MPFVERTVQRYGVEIDNIFYYHDVLRRWINAPDPDHRKQKRKFRFRRFYPDLSSTWFHDPVLDDYFEIPTSDSTFPAMSIWDLHKIRREAKAEGATDSQVDEVYVKRRYFRMREIEEQAVMKTKAARKLSERRRGWETVPKPQVVSAPQAEADHDSDLGQSYEKVRGLPKMPEDAVEARDLHATALEALYWDDAARINRVWDLKTQWIPYTRAKILIREAEELLSRPKAPRMPCLLVYADPNSGKTAIHRHYCGLHHIDLNLDGDAIRARVIGIETRSPAEGALYDAILRTIHAPFRVQDRADKKRHQVLTILERIGTRQLLIDELNTAIAGPFLKQKKFLVALKNLLNELEMTAFAMGTPEARIALAPDPQLESRFEMQELQRWTDDEELRKLLESFECRLPLREPSELQAPAFARRIYELTEGYIGEIAELLMRAAVKAIVTKKERIDRKRSWIT